MRTDARDVENRNWSVIPFEGGCDFETSKAIVRPGTLQDCLNYEVISSGYSRGQGLLRYGGTYDRPVTNFWVVGGRNPDTSFSGTMRLGRTVRWEGGFGTCIHVEDSGDRKIIGLVDVEGEHPSDQTTFTQDGTGAVMTVGGADKVYQLLVDPVTGALAPDPFTGGGLVTEMFDYREKLQGIAEDIASDSSSAWPYFKPGVPGTGPINGGWQFKDKVYVARDYYSILVKTNANTFNEDILIGSDVEVGLFRGTIAGVEMISGHFHVNDSLMYLYLKPTSTGDYDESQWLAAMTDGAAVTFDPDNLSITMGNVENDSSYPIADWFRKSVVWRAEPAGWTPVESGYAVRFTSGTNAPNASINPLYIEQGVEVVQSTDWIAADAITQTSSARIGWTNPGEAADADDTYANCDIGVGEKSAMLRATFNDVVLSPDSEILGIEVRIKARVSPVDTGDVAFHKVELFDSGKEGQDALLPGQFNSLSVADRTIGLTTTNTNYTFGGQTDLWGYKGKTVEAFNNGDIGVQYEFQYEGGDPNIQVDATEIKIHYVPRSQRVWFHAGAGVDVTSGFLYSYNLHAGAWANNDAEGWINLSGVTTPGAVYAGLEIRTGPAGSGTLIATTASQVTSDQLPGAAEMAAEGSQYEVVEANFYENEDGKAIFGCTGAGPSFMVDTNDTISFIRLPVAPDKDKPRHVQFHRNHLVLSVGSHILVSAVGSPTVFNTAEDATSWALRDRVTGLSPLPGNTLGVMCERSIHAFSGSSFNDFQLQHVSLDSGAIEYTVADVGGPLYADYNGVANVVTTDRTGNYRSRPFTDPVYDWVRDRCQGLNRYLATDSSPQRALAVRGKNQYRLFFKDGYILNLNVNVGRGGIAQPMIGHYDTTNFGTDYVPTWTDSAVLSSGRERLVMGDSNGKVWIIDGANALADEDSVTYPDCSISINPVNLGYPQGAHRTLGVTLHGDFYGVAEVDYTIGGDYLAPSGSERTKTVGSFNNPPQVVSTTDYTDITTNQLTDGYSIKLQTSMDALPSHKLHMLLHRSSRKGQGRNNTQTNRG